MAEPFWNRRGYLMASLTLKSIPDDLLRRLRAAAEEDRRSLNGQILHLLALSLEGGSRARRAPADVEAQVAAWRRLAGRWESELDAKAEARALIRRRSSGRKVEL